MSQLIKLASTGTEPVTLAEAKAVTRVEHSADDTLLAMLISTARQQAEQRIERALVSQQWRLDLDAFPAGAIELPMPPLASVQSITWLDDAGARQTLAVDQYHVVTGSIPGFVLPAYGLTWPAARAQPGSIQISFTCGYASAADVPTDIKHWIQLAVATWYAHRETLISGQTVEELPRAFWMGLLDPYRRLGV